MNGIDKMMAALDWTQFKLMDKRRIRRPAAGAATPGQGAIEPWCPLQVLTGKHMGYTNAAAAMGIPTSLVIDAADDGRGLNPAARNLRRRMLARMRAAK